MNLEQLRKQAKELTAAARAGDATGLARLGDLPVRLASAQLVLAREHGHASWTALVHALEASVESCVVAATSSRCERARRLLDARPEIAADPWARLVLGRRWDGDATTPGGPRGWAPLLYVTHSCFASAALARDLLANGADPDVTFTNEYGEMSALYGAAGVVHDPELTRLLLQAGANPDDGESLYRATEALDPACLRLLLEHGASTSDTNALAHAIDGARLEHVTLLLDAGADPNEGRGALLVHAVRRGCEPEMIRLLAARGAERDRRGGEWSTPRSQYRTAYQNAVLRSRDDVAELLAQLGADTDVVPGDLAVAALARGVRPGTALPAEPDADADAQEVLILAALHGHLDAIVDALGPAFFGHVGGGPPGTLLHHACWVGDAGVVDRLLAPAPIHRHALARSTTRRSRGRRSGPSITARPGATTSRSPSGCLQPARSSSRASLRSPRARSPTGSRPRPSPAASARTRDRSPRRAPARSGTRCPTASGTAAPCTCTRSGR